MPPAHAKEDSWIKTFTGRRFYPFNPHPEDIDIMDIAHALSMQCRFSGHLIQFYSVAQHSCSAHDLIAAASPRAKFWALMHDSTETYIGDMASPIKWFFPDYSEMEDLLALRIIERFQIPYDQDIEHEVKQVDNWLVFQEGHLLLRNAETEVWQARTQRPTTFEHVPLDRIPLWTPMQARYEFLNRFHALTMELAAA